MSNKRISFQKIIILNNTHYNRLPETSKNLEIFRTKRIVQRRPHVFISYLNTYFLLINFTRKGTTIINHIARRDRSQVSFNYNLKLHLTWFTYQRLHYKDIRYVILYGYLNILDNILINLKCKFKILQLKTD